MLSWVTKLFASNRHPPKGTYGSSCVEPEPSSLTFAALDAAVAEHEEVLQKIEAAAIPKRESVLAEAKVISDYLNSILPFASPGVKLVDIGGEPWAVIYITGPGFKSGHTISVGPAHYSRKRLLQEVADAVVILKRIAPSYRACAKEMGMPT